MLCVAAFYEFKEFCDFKNFQNVLDKFCDSLEIKGLILLAQEGINGTVCGTFDAIKLFKDKLAEIGFLNLEYKESYADKMPFFRLKVKLKKEIVTLGLDYIDPNKNKGKYIAPKDWNDFINQDDVVLIDTRNDYEYKIGTFANAINPKTDSFSQLPSFVEENKHILKNKKIAMFCTGGIRCEKSTAYMKSIGYDEVYHLQGGILKYLEEVPQEDSSWQGECFVFDQRVSIKHKLELGTYTICHGCRMPINDDDKAHPKHIEGVKCIHCYDKYSDNHYERMAQRQKQLKLAQQAGVAHMGSSRHILEHCISSNTYETKK